MVNKAALKGMSDTIAALLPIIKADLQKLSKASGKALEGETDVEKEAANAKADKAAVQMKEPETIYTKTSLENKLLSWISSLSTSHIIIVAIVVTLLIWRLQISTPKDTNNIHEQIVHSRAVYLKDIEKELIDARPSLNVSDRYGRTACLCKKALRILTKRFLAVWTCFYDLDPRFLIHWM